MYNEIDDMLTAQIVDNDRRSDRLVRILKETAKIPDKVSRDIYAERINRVFGIENASDYIKQERKDLLTITSPLLNEIIAKAVSLSDLKARLNEYGLPPY